MPVALKTALATAAPAPQMPSSPSYLLFSGFALSSSFAGIRPHRRNVGVDRHVILGEVMILAEVMIDEVTVAAVDYHLLAEGRAPAEGHPADRL